MSNWSVVRTPGHNRNISIEPGIAKMRGGPYRATSEMLSEAFLMAAAPEMYEALEVAKRCIEEAKHKNSIAQHMTVIRNAMAKARGEK